MSGVTESPTARKMLPIRLYHVIISIPPPQMRRYAVAAVIASSGTFMIRASPGANTARRILAAAPRIVKNMMDAPIIRPAPFLSLWPIL